MTTPTFAKTHNLIAYLAKPTESEGFKQIIDFLNESLVRYAFTGSPTIRTSCIKQFWSTAKVKTVNDEVRVQALIDGKKVTIKESFIHRTLKLDDEESISCLANDDIFTVLANMGYEMIALVLKPPPRMNLAALWHHQSSALPQTRSLTSQEGWYMFFGVITPLFENMLVPAAEEGRMIADMDEDIEDIDEEDPAKVEEVLEVVKAAKLMTEETTTSVIVHIEVQPKDKVKGILIEEPKPLKRQAQIEAGEAFSRQLEAELNANINYNDVVEQVKRSERQNNKVISDIKPIFEKHYNSIQAFLKKKEDEVTVQEKRQCESLEQETTKKQRMDEEAEELKRHLEDLEALWKLVKERFETTEPKNFSGDFLLNILKIMFEKPNIEASVWKYHKRIYGLAKVKSWKLFESCGVHIITFTTTQMILMVEKKYPLTHFTLHQMLANVRLEVEEESEMSLELLRLVRRQLNEEYMPE
nr:hypothetical protein [Tanacetum cinerariifolium]